MPRLLWLLVLSLSLLPSNAFAHEPPERARKITQKTMPAYPELARRLNLTGVVKLEVTVTPEGEVKQIEVLGGNPVFSKAAQDAVSRWKWVHEPQETKEIIQLSFRPR